MQAESVSVQPYRHEPYRLHSDEEATENDQPELCDRLDIYPDIVWLNVCHAVRWVHLSPTF